MEDEDIIRDIFFAQQVTDDTLEYTNSTYYINMYIHCIKETNK